MNNESSLIQEINGSRYPDKKLDFWIGMIILVILLNQEIPWISAASSISPDSCNIAFIPLLEANGRYLTEPQSARSANEP